MFFIGLLIESVFRRLDDANFLGWFPDLVFRHLAMRAVSFTVAAQWRIYTAFPIYFLRYQSLPRRSPREYVRVVAYIIHSIQFDTSLFCILFLRLSR